MTTYTSPAENELIDRVKEALLAEGDAAQAALAAALVRLFKGREDVIKVILEESGFSLDELDE